MSLNIKNERVHDLARQAAAVTGKTKTGVIEEALVLLLKEYGADPAETAGRAKLDRLHSILGELDALPVDPDREITGTDDLYDDATGLPR